VIQQHETAVGCGVGQPLFRRTAKGLRTRQVGDNTPRYIISVHAISIFKSCTCAAVVALFKIIIGT